jgi:hypothetical protein
MPHSHWKGGLSLTWHPWVRKALEPRAAHLSSAHCMTSVTRCASVSLHLKKVMQPESTGLTSHVNSQEGNWGLWISEDILIYTTRWPCVKEFHLDKKKWMFPERQGWCLKHTNLTGVPLILLKYFWMDSKPWCLHVSLIGSHYPSHVKTSWPNLPTTHWISPIFLLILWNAGDWVIYF